MLVKKVVNFRGFAEVVRILTVASMLSVTLSAFSQEVVMPATLKDTMKAMSDRLKVITTQVVDPGKNAQSQALSEEFVVLVKHAKTFIPKKVEALGPADKGPALDKYSQMLDQAGDLGLQLSAAFKVNDNKKATDLLNQLAATKKDGHTQFK